MILCAKMAFLNTTKMIGHVKTFLLHICPELCDMYILYYYYYEKTKKLTMNLLLKTQPSRIIMLPYYIKHMIFSPLSIFFIIITPMINSILSHKPNRIHIEFKLLHGLIISGNNLRNRLFHAVICYYRIV